MLKKNKENKIDYIDILLFIAPFITGLLSIWSLALFSVLCVCGILYKVVKNKKIILPKGKNIVFISIYILSFLVVEFYAIDKGMNVLAFFKNLSILIFILLYMQFENSNKSMKDRFKVIPYSACTTVIYCLVLILIPESNIFIENRLQGTFFYANSYGLFLLIGTFVLFCNEKYSWKDYAMLLILFIGIILTNSRAIIILTVATLIITLFFNKQNLKSKIIIATCFVLLFVGIYAFSKIEKRINADMANSSEFITRLLYYKDAFQMIKENPFGYGYEGWYYKQSEIQTGVYDTKYVHNSLLQVSLDVGILPTILLIILLASTFFSKRQNYFSRIIMILIIGHSLIDIDLEYIYFILLLVPFIEFKYAEIKLNKSYYLILGLLSALCIWYFMLFISDVCFSSKDYESAIKIIPFHTEAMQEMLYNTSEQQMQLKYANDILKYNKNVSGAYEAIRNDLVEKEKYMKAIDVEEKRLLLNKYAMYNYLEYADLLSKALRYYGEKEDVSNQKVILEKIIDIELKIKNVLENTNPLCYKTIHTPNLEIPIELQEFIDKAKEAQD